MAGCGKLDNSLLLDQDQRKKWRDQALFWLSNDLDDWRQVAVAAQGKNAGSSDADRIDAAVAALETWKQAECLACVREPNGIAALREHERIAWHEFWDEVDETLQILRQAND